MHITGWFLVCAFLGACGGSEYIDTPPSDDATVKTVGKTFDDLGATGRADASGGGATGPDATTAPDATAPDGGADAAAPALTCNIDETLNDGFCYSTPGIKWMDYQTATTLCVTRGAHVAEILSDAENKFVLSLLQKMPIGGGQAAWIALQRTTGAHFRWVSGQAATYVAWAPGEPNNETGNENCVVIWGTNLKVTALHGLWNDAACDDPGRDTVICKRKAAALP